MAGLQMQVLQCSLSHMEADFFRRLILTTSNGEGLIR